MSLNIDQIMALNEYTITPTMYNFYKERVGISDSGYNDRHLNEKDLAIISKYKKFF
jgi:hypothetical protein